MVHPLPAPGADDYPSPAQQAGVLHEFLKVKNPSVTLQLAAAVIQELAPTKDDSVKRLAARLKRVMNTFGQRVKHTHALEVAARIQGNTNWHTSPLGLRAEARSEGSAPVSPFCRAQGIFAVDDPEVLEVLDRSTGRYERHCDVIGDDWERALQLRMEVQTHLDINPRFLCSQCLTPVYLVSRPEGKKLFFRHTLEDGRCSAVTRGQLSQQEIDARKYNGVKESWLHIELKRWIVEGLRADGRFTDIVVEGRWAGELTGAWRKPDVRALFNGVRVAFEVQLSTTYINVIAERREFYRREGGLLFWVFSQFNLGARRLTQDDVFFNNNRNAFIVNPRTRDESLARNRFMLECVWASPQVGEDDAGLHRQVVAFDALTLDQASQRAFYFDFDGERSRIRQQVEDRQHARRKALRDRFEAFYASYLSRHPFGDEDWHALRQEFAAEGAQLPDHPGRLPIGLLNAVYSAKYGRVYGWLYPSFIQVAHHMEPGMRQYLHYFRRALKAYDRADLIRKEDQTGKWAQKVIEYKTRMRARDPAYTQDTRYDQLVEVLFPEVMAVDVEGRYTTT